MFVNDWMQMDWKRLHTCGSQSHNSLEDVEILKNKSSVEFLNWRTVVTTDLAVSETPLKA